jgi:eukaryotic-like serine/threonine-protein kinase
MAASMARSSIYLPVILATGSFDYSLLPRFADVSNIRDQLQLGLGAAYALERELGGGGMSRVFVATDTSLNRSVVIKVIAPDLLEGMSAERFAREVRLAARLQQANIVPVLAAGDANGLPYYTMPFVRGESLRVRLTSGAPTSVADAIHILRDIARALAYAHGEGIVHRDIKPENVLLSGGAAVVTDFGIAKAIDLSRTQDGERGAANVTLTQAGSSLGTPAYMSPEQAAGDPSTDHRADIYAWGMIAWELLAGRHPFSNKTSLHAMVTAQLTEIPAPLASVRRDVPLALSTLVQRCLEKDPNRRPMTASELLTSLDQAVSTGSGTVPSTAPAKKAGRRAVVAIAALAIASVAVVMIAKRRTAGATTAADPDKSLAVIPFASSSSDTTNAYLAEGIADEVTNTLAQVPGLRIAGRSSSARFAGKSATAQDVGRALNVGSVLDGTVQRSGDRIRVSVELSNVSDGVVVWHESYEQAASNLFAVQDEIARAIAGQLQVTLAGAGRGSVHGTNDAAAYDLYLKGMYLYRRRGPQITEAIGAFEQATVRDSNFARAWAALSNALTVAPSYTLMRDGDVLPRAKIAAERAVRLDSTLSDAHLALGYVHAESFEWPEAEAELRRAIELDPSAAEPRYRLGYTLMNQGRPAEAIPVLQLAVARDPLYFITAVYLGWAEAESGRAAEGLAEQRRALALEPNSVTVLSTIGLGFVRAGLPDSSKLYAHRLLAISTSPARLGVAAFVLARSGATAEAQAIVKRLEATPSDTWNRWTGLAEAYSGLGDTTRALDAMEHASAGDGDAFPLYSNFMRLVGNMASGPRFEAVLRRYHLDPARFVDKPTAR